MRTQSLHSTLAQRGTAVMIPMAIVLIAVLVAGTAQAQSPSGADSNPCDGLPSLTMTLHPATLAAGNDLTKTTSTPSGGCSLTVTLQVSAHTPNHPQLAEGASCTVTATPTPISGGASVDVRRSNICMTLPATTTISVSEVPASAAGAAGAAGASSSAAFGNAFAKTMSYDKLGFLMFRHQISARWRYTLIDVLGIWPRNPDRWDNIFWHEEADRQGTAVHVDPVEIGAWDEVDWHSDGFPESSAPDVRITTRSTVWGHPGGGYSCTHSDTGWRVTFDVRGFPLPFPNPYPGLRLQHDCGP